jgi:hypothetical protein
MINLKTCERKRSWLIFGTIAEFASRDSEKPWNLRQESGSPRRDFNPRPQEYKVALPATGPRHAISVFMRSLFAGRSSIGPSLSVCLSVTLFEYLIRKFLMDFGKF